MVAGKSSQKVITELFTASKSQSVADVFETNRMNNFRQPSATIQSQIAFEPLDLDTYNAQTDPWYQLSPLELAANSPTG